MKYGPVTKLDKKNKTTLKKIDDDVMSTNCDSLSSFRFLANLEQSRSRTIVCKTYIFIKSNLYLTKTENRTKKSLTQLPHYC